MHLMTQCITINSMESWTFTHLVAARYVCAGHPERGQEGDYSFLQWSPVSLGGQSMPVVNADGLTVHATVRSTVKSSQTDHCSASTMDSTVI